jgi:hypothetical protein
MTPNAQTILMKTILVSLISDQTIPNYLFIKEMAGRYDSLLFISTFQMQEKKKLEAILNTLQSVDYIVDKQIIVEEDLLPSIVDKLSKEVERNDCSFIVNLTGGTKIMSLGVFEFFSRLDASFYYIPIGKNVIRNIKNEEEIPIAYQLNLKEYLNLYGLNFEADNRLLFSEEHTYSFFERFKNYRFNRYKMPEILNAQSLSSSVKRVYYSGAWFEEYCLLRLKRELKLADNRIMKGVKIYRDKSMNNTSDNEIDIIFVKNNELFIFECKVTIIGRSLDPKKELDGFLYKLAAISKDFGLKVNSYVFTLHNLNKLSPDRKSGIEKRRQILGVRKILDCNDFKERKLNIL